MVLLWQACGSDACPLLAQSGHTDFAPHMSAFGGIADMTSLGFHALFLPKAGGSLCKLVGSQSMNSQSDLRCRRQDYQRPWEA